MCPPHTEDSLKPKNYHVENEEKWSEKKGGVSTRFCNMMGGCKGNAEHIVVSGMKQGLLHGCWYFGLSIGQSNNETEARGQQFTGIIS